VKKILVLLVAGTLLSGAAACYAGASVLAERPAEKTR
jgi:hypothetical protein